MTFGGSHETAVPEIAVGSIPFAVVATDDGTACVDAAELGTRKDVVVAVASFEAVSVVAAASAVARSDDTVGPPEHLLHDCTATAFDVQYYHYWYSEHSPSDCDHLSCVVHQHGGSKELQKEPPQVHVCQRDHQPN